MNNREYKNMEETLKNFLGNKVDNDAKVGNDLLQKCGINERKHFCSDEHRNEVVKYISRIDKEYYSFINGYAISLGKSLTGIKVPINCETLSFYVDVVNKVKKTKDLGKNVDYLIKLMSGGNNNEQKF